MCAAQNYITPAPAATLIEQTEQTTAHTKGPLFVELHLDATPRDNMGNMSQTDLVYWALAEYKGSLFKQLFTELETTTVFDEAVEALRNQIECIGELQNTLFTSVSPAA